MGGSDGVEQGWEMVGGEKWLVGCSGWWVVVVGGW